MKNNTPSQQNPAVEFLIHKIFTKDLSFESPSTPLIFTKQWQPEAHIDINTASVKLDDKNYEVTLTLTATAKSNNETAFVAETKQAGIFTISGATEAQCNHILGSFCPSTLFPYAREAIANVIVRGGFPELNIAPINFDALYAQSVQQSQTQTKQ